MGMDDRRREEGGWTLLELVLTVSLIGLLAALAAPAFHQIGDGEKARAQTIVDVVVVVGDIVGECRDLRFCRRIGSRFEIVARHRDELA